MRSTTQPRRADFVKPRLHEARISRMWSKIERAQTRSSLHRIPTWSSIGVLTAAAGIVLVLWFRPWLPWHGQGTTSAVSSGDTFATEAQQRQVTLPDGTVLSIGASTRLEVIRLAHDEVRLHLLRGVVTCDVPRVDGRQFVVEAGSADITVKGTRFTVELMPEATSRPELSVSVEHGLVQVRPDGHTVAAMLQSGQLWSSRKTESGAANSVIAPEGSASQASSLPSAFAKPAALPSVPSAAAPPPALLAPKTVRAEASSAADLMQRANAARLGGRPGDAAREYAQLCERYPGDARSGLAAFELGRIRLNSLGDARGAIEAFRLALAHSNGAFFPEDAEAGIVQAWHRLGDTRACVTARDAFLERHPKSAQAARVRQFCGAR